MKSLTTLAIVLSTILSTLGTTAATNDRFPWLTDLDEARELAASKDMPMLVVFRCEP